MSPSAAGSTAPTGDAGATRPGCSPQVAIIDSGGANLASLRYALERLGAQACVTDDALLIERAPRVLLPGVGAAGAAMQRLRERGLDRLIPRLRQPLLGICLGMQLLFEGSEEDDAECLGVLGGCIGRLLAAPGAPVPHMGWNTLEALRPDPLLEGLGESDYFYFVHGYAAAPGPDTLASVRYRLPLAAVVRRANFWGVQFHPERSAQPGARLLANFLALPDVRDEAPAPPVSARAQTSSPSCC